MEKLGLTGGISTVGGVRCSDSRLDSTILSRSEFDTAAFMKRKKSVIA